MRDLERTWNSKFNYPWTFFNDVPFTEEFKRRTSAETKAKCNYELIPKEQWAVPSWINSDLFTESAQILKEQDIQYGNLVSYHQMCRWNSGLFYQHPALKNIKYYWRVEPKVHFFCDIDYDVFRYMADHNKTYGFVINLYDAPQSMPSLWPETKKFLAAHPEYEEAVGEGKNAREWLEDSKRRPEHNMKANGYSTCHFWSNFEIGDMDFFRGKAYDDYFQHLDRAGGFFYERWGDAPVHSIGLGLFEDASKIHWYVSLCPSQPYCSIIFSLYQSSPEKLTVWAYVGFATLATNTSPTSIVPTPQNATVALKVDSQMEKDSFIKKTVDPIGSRWWAQAE